MKTRVIKQQLNCELPEVEPPANYTLEYTPAASQSLTAQRSKEAARLREEGLTIPEIANRLGVCQSNASMLSRIGNPKLAVRRNAKTNSRRKIIAEMAAAGHTHKEIAKYIGVCRQTVSLHAAEMAAQQNGDQT